MMMAASALNEGEDYEEFEENSDSSDNDSAMYHRHDQENWNH